MRKRLAFLLVLAALLSLVLVACGDETAPVPTYPGATSITLPDSIKSQFTATLANYKNTAADGFKTTDDLAKVKSSFQSSFKSAGWDDVSDKLASQAGAKAITDAGGFIIGFTKGNKGANVIAVPNAYAEGSGFTGINAGENPYIVISGNTQ
jgi:ABC-type uncharacterized transport system auxiliary subunit